jgi:AcrR family transcriptional regulator
MGKRAVSAAETHRRILKATIELYGERFHDQITLADIAARADVTVQTVLRRFRSKDELMEAAGELGAAEVVEQRGQAPVGDVPGIVANLFDHYEEWGRPALRALSQEDRVPQLRKITSRGRELHAAWVRTVFAPFLEKSPRDGLLESQLAAVTDIYVWKLLREDRGLDRDEAARALTGMVEAIVSKGGDA